MSPDGTDNSTMVRAMRRRAWPLAGGAVLMLVAAWEVDPNLGPIVAFFAGLAGWLTCWVVLRAPPPKQPAQAAPVPAPTPSAAEQLSKLRHDMRGILSPAMLIADRLLAHQDPAVKRAGTIVASTVERAAARLEETKSGGEGK